MSDAAGRVPIPGLAEWVQKQRAEELLRRSVFRERVRERNDAIDRAVLDGTNPPPQPFRCDACAAPLSNRDVGIVTRSGKLIHQRCRVGVYR